ncbi:hypothetical protein ES705_18698 [subsurface metagenome]
MRVKNLQQWQKAVLERDDHTCQNCGSRLHLEAHHIKPIGIYPELALEVDNGKTLCSNCHNKIPVQIRPGISYVPEECVGKLYVR